MHAFEKGLPQKRLFLHWPNEGFEGCTLGIDAQRYSFALLVLCYKTMDELWDEERKRVIKIGPSCQKKMKFNIVTKGQSAKKSVTFALPDRVHALLIVVAERSICRRLKVSGVHPPAGHWVTALTHACVVPQTTLIQIRMRQSITACDALDLWMETHRIRIITTTTYYKII